MKKQVLFIQGGGEDGYAADEGMVQSLMAALGSGYEVHYPRLTSNEDVSDFGWPGQIGALIDDFEGNVIVVAHSLGASLLLKYLSQSNFPKKINGLFLIATPFWSGDQDWVQGLILPENFGHHIPNNIPIFLYHCMDDEVAPFTHLSIYAKKLPHAIVREIEIGGHQMNNDLKIVANDIKAL